MTGIAITMMIMFMIVIWGGLAATLVHLQRHPDEQSGHFGTHPLTRMRCSSPRKSATTCNAQPNQAPGWPRHPVMTATINAHAMDLGTVGASISDQPPRTPAMI